MGRWYRLADAGGAYTIQGAVVGVEGIASGVVVRPDVQSEEEILNILDNLGGHKEDAALQRKMIPEWAINRGGKVAVEFKHGPTGYTAGETGILVSEWVTTEQTAILLHPKISGIIAAKGGATSHAVVVARARSIPIIVDVPEAARIQPGDNLWFDASSGIIKVNGGDAGFEGTEVKQAEEPIYAFVWSKGQGAYDRITPGSEGQVAIHMELAQKGMQEGWFDFSDTGMGVIYENGRVQLYQYPSDQDRMIEWLNTIHPVTSVE